MSEPTATVPPPPADPEAEARRRREQAAAALEAERAAERENRAKAWATRVQQAPAKQAVVQSRSGFRLMFGLFYPAVLGNAVFLLALAAIGERSWAGALTNPQIHIGLLYVWFFSASFAASYRAEHYGLGALACDVTEVLLMFVCFYFLGLIVVSTPQGGESPAPRFILAYRVLLFTFLEQFAWRFFAKVQPDHRWLIRWLILAALAAGSLVGDRFASPIAAAIAVLVGLYLWAPSWLLSLNDRLQMALHEKVLTAIPLPPPDNVTR
jgi:hypothetical protein